MELEGNLDDLTKIEVHELARISLYTWDFVNFPEERSRSTETGGVSVSASVSDGSNGGGRASIRDDSCPGVG